MRCAGFVGGRGGWWLRRTSLGAPRGTVLAAAGFRELFVQNFRSVALAPTIIPADTVGQPPSNKIGVPNMPSLKAKKLGKLPQEQVLLEL